MGLCFCRYLTKYAYLGVNPSRKLGIQRRLINNINDINQNSNKIMRVLNVAEKNDAAKNIAAILSRGACNRREGLSKFNKIYQFNMQLWNQNCQMVMTSVSGHLLGFEFSGAYRKWLSCHPLSLFDAPVTKICSGNSSDAIKRTLEREVRNCNALIIWTDCDREGENIGYEIIQVCQQIKPNIQIHRAIFSEITAASITRAVHNLAQPNKAVSDAVDVRSELDLRIGAAFTRFQTLRLTKVFPQTLSNMLISYGSCQFPTLGFVVERFLAIERFQPEPYWKLKVTDEHDGICVNFNWARNRLFEKLPCEIFLDICQESGDAVVEKVDSKPKSKWRPVPLDTIELEKQGSRKLRLNAKDTMKIAEKLYSQGFISYPRTETNIFPKELNLRGLVEQQVDNQNWGEFAQRVLNDGVTPRQGKKTDHAHPPIHPTKKADNLQGNEARVYEFVVRHFLACVSKNAEGFETTVSINVGGEKFFASGLQILEKNYLEVYIYETWSDKPIHIYRPGQIFRPTNIEMIQEKTSPPSLLTEADLISLMDKHGIGTDATHAEHIDTIKARQYVGLRDQKHFMPGKLGIGLVMGYDNMGFPMSKPNLRSELEKDLKLICERRKNPQEVLETQIRKYRDVFQLALDRTNVLDTSLSEYLDERPAGGVDLAIDNPPEEPTVFKCPRCGNNMVLKQAQNRKFFIGCMTYPNCNNSIWFPAEATEVKLADNECNVCPGGMKKLLFKFIPGFFPLFGTNYQGCIGGCDEALNDLLKISLNSIRRVEPLDDSGFVGSNNSTIDVRNVNNRVNASGASSSNTQSRPSTSGSQSRPSASSVSQNRSANHRPSSRDDGNLKRIYDDWGDSLQDNKRTKMGKTESSAGRENINPAWNNTRNSNNTGNTNNTGEVMCNCGENAILLTVKKEGPNKGRQFYRCPSNPGKCQFFLWASDFHSTRNEFDGNDDDPMPPPPPRPGNVRANNWNSNNNFNNPGSSRSQTDWGSDRAGPSSGGRDADVMCRCNRPAKKFTVSKEGKNKGRQFYTCIQQNKCQFFEWTDDGPSQSNDEFNNFKSKHNGPNLPGKKRKCSVCGIEGHTKRTCQQNAMDD